MLTGGGDPQALPWLRPAKAQSGMQGKARFVLKDHGLIRLQGAEFFLSLAETSPLLRSWPASTSNWPVSCGSPIGASTAGLVVPSALSQTVASNASPGSARPNALGLTQRTGGTDPGVFAAPFRLCCSVGKGGPVWLSDSGPRFPQRLPHESSGLSSCGSTLRPYRSNQDAVLPKPATMQRSLSRPRLPESVPPTPAIAAFWQRGESRLTLGFSCLNRSMNWFICNYI